MRHSTRLLPLLLLLLAACGGSSGSGDDTGGDDAPDGGVPRGAPGEVDPAFGADGTLAVTNGVKALTGDGAGGAVYLGNGLAHLDEALAPDPAATDLAIGNFERLFATADGRYLALHDDYWTASNNRVARLGADFAIDPGFAHGDALTDLGPAEAVAAPDGSVFVAGTASFTTDDQVMVKKLGPTGALDTGWGDGGVAVTPEALDLRASGLVRLADGAIVVRAEDGFTPALVRFTAAGALDTAWGDGGVVRITALGPRYSRALAVDATGGLLLLGMTNSRIQLARILADGSLDPGFGAAGVASVDITMPLSSAYDEHVEARALVVAADGTIVVTADYEYDLGEDDVLEEESILVARFDAAGALDPTFGDAGTTRVHLGAGDTPSHNAYEGAAVEVSDRRLLIGGDVRVDNAIRGGVVALFL